MPNPDASSSPRNLRSRNRKVIHEDIEITDISSARASSFVQARPEDYLFGEEISSELGEANESTEARKTSSKFQNVMYDRPDNIRSDSLPYKSDSENSDSEDSNTQSISSVEQEKETNSPQVPPCNGFSQGFSIQALLNDCYLGVIICLIIALYLGSCVLYCNDEEGMVNKPNNLTEDFERVWKQFNKQDEDFWRSIRVGVEEILELEQPRVIVFLYKNDSMAITKNIIAKVSKAAVCYLSDCSQEPIDIEGSVLNTTELQDDFGSIVTNYREQLKKSGVFIIQNLQLVPGKSAQALHLFCDEYNPVVERALFLFTVKVDEFIELPDIYTAISFLEDLLLKVWNDLGVHDKFHPLFTRISGTVLSVRPQ
ncbi:unnamed protein product [Ceutorhynchus assimilis]|uniref:Torsin-1A-interacting protein 2 n=1 Tax=Ceutorhynchus assimilis TaxID=467358 RepID=A0A9N9MCY0_9CUCU|nr:unnamed protein product [Ceutorhynchus assimilis]